MRPLLKPWMLPALLMLAACAAAPTGPSVMVVPGTGRSLGEFRDDDAVCRQYAYIQAGGKAPAQAATASGVGTAAAGTVMGAAAGTAIDGSTGAAVGAGSGLATGSVAGTGTAAVSAETAQARSDIGYIQCMYAKGNRVPVPGNIMYQYRHAPYPPPPECGGTSVTPSSSSERTP